MAIENLTNRLQYVGNNSTVTPYVVSFPFYAATDLVVTVTDEDGVDEPLANITDYAVTGGDGSAGSITTTEAIPATHTVTIVRSVPLTQDTTFTGVGKFPSESVDKALDRLAMAVQQLQRQVDRAIRVPDTRAALEKLQQAEADGIIGFDNAGDAKIYDAAALLSLLQIDGDITVTVPEGGVVPSSMDADEAAGFREVFDTPSNADLSAEEAARIAADALKANAAEVPRLGLGWSYLEAGGLFWGLHRGGPITWPEETMEAYRASLAAGAVVIELDVQLLADGAVAVMHDETVDRTTDGTGNVGNFSAITFKRLIIDTPITTQQGYGTSVHPPLLIEVLSEFGNRVPILLEVKSAAVAAPTLALLERFGIARDMVLINSFTSSWMEVFREAGYRTCSNFSNYLGSPSPSTIAARDAWVLLDWEHLSYAAALRSAGVKVGAYLVNTHFAATPLLDQVDAIWSDDAVYQSGLTRRTTDPFILQTFYPGHRPYNSGASPNGGKGEFVAPNLWGYDRSSANTHSASLMGWACPIGGSVAANSAPSVVINFSVRFDAAFNSTRLAFLSLFNEDSAFSSDNNTNKSGYTFICRKDGTLEIYRADQGVEPYSIGLTTEGTTITDGSTATFRITVTPTHVKLERLDVPTEINVADATYRGPFLHAGVKGIEGYFSISSITTP